MALTQARLRRRSRSRRSSTTSTSTRPSRARRTSRTQHLPVFDCAFKPAHGERSIHYMGHVRMMGAIQPFLSGAISKTVNMPRTPRSRRSSRSTSRAGSSASRRSRSTATARKRTQPLNTAKDKAKRRRRRASRGSVAAASRAAPQAAGRAPRDHPQVRHRRPRGLHHRRPLRGRPPGEIFLDDGQGRLDDLGPDGRLRDGDLATRSSTACRCRTSSTSSATSASSRRASPGTRTSGSPSRSSTTSSAGWRRSSCRRRRSSAPASTTARRRVTTPEQLPLDVRPPQPVPSATGADQLADDVVVRGDAEPGRRAAVLDVRVDHGAQRARATSARTAARPAAARRHLDSGLVIRASGRSSDVGVRLLLGSRLIVASAFRRKA